ncbi:hypothetical protein G6F22_012668 [Rhizopus arrhizus]|nr:hypothetical protein G6F22_012668 [Rhizopus arrhizus]
MDMPPAAPLPDLDWARITESLDAHGNAIAPGLLTPAQCAALAAGYAAPDGYRSRIVMARHGFGRGEYKYFSYPLPPLLQQLRTALYPQLVPIANRWNRQLGINVQYPADHAAFLQRCHDAGQRRPVRRTRVPAAGGGAAVAPRPGLHGRRIRDDGNQQPRTVR